MFPQNEGQDLRTLDHFLRILWVGAKKSVSATKKKVRDEISELWNQWNWHLVYKRKISYFLD